MHDLKWIRDHPESFDQSLKKRGFEPLSMEILKRDETRRLLQTKLQELLQQRNEIAKQTAVARSKGEEIEGLLKKGSEIKEKIPELEAQEKKMAEELDGFLVSLPNILSEDVPEGESDQDNKEIRRYGEPREFSFQPKEHFEIGEALNLMDFEGASRLSGSRFVVLKGALARLERALSNFMLDLHTTEFGYQEVETPILVRDEAAFGTGQLPKFEEDLFKTTNGFWLIPSAEVTLTNLVAGQILAEKDLPLRLTAYTQCFRSEAGAAGRDTKGMLRQHQFGKVELVSITSPEKSAAEHERMTQAAEEVLKRLELPYRVITLCTKDTGFSAGKTYDIEVWMPGQGVYREISSCSNCLDFQARRMKARFRPHEGEKPQFVHTLNGSGLAVGRTVIAVIENYQQADGTIQIPKALRPYMGGMTEIRRAE